MTPLWNQRTGREAPRPRRGLTDQRMKLPKCPNAAPRQSLPSYAPRSRARRLPTDYGHLESSVIGESHWGEPGVPRASGYHARHAEASPVRPRIVTVVRPSGKESPRKISLLLNRRAVQTFEQLVADVSEALGFPCWNKARIRRLFSPAGREIHSLADFFRVDNAFLAFGISRPSLDEIHVALNELYPENLGYCEHLLRIWERMLRPKATKADSGFHDDDPEASLPAACDQQVNQPIANNLQPVGGQGRQREKVKKERQKKDRELWMKKGDLQKDDKKEPKKEERKTEPVYCKSCRGCGPPIPPIRTKSHSQPNRPNTQSETNTTSENTPHRSPKVDENVANPNSTPTAHQSQHNALIMETIFERPTQQETVSQRNLQGNLPPDGAEVSLEDIERSYEIGRVVGDGNFAVVRECRVRGVSETFAMKIVDNAKLQGRSHMIQNEIALLRSLKHPRLIQLFRSHHTDTHVYLLMELVTGGDLFDLLIAQSGRFNEPSAACMITDISQALEYIHNKSIAHRDIKPENLLVQRNSSGGVNLKLADFGLAMVITEPVFTVCGTPTYVAPEILAETGYGVAVDVWAMGVILFVLLSGFPPFRSPDRNQEELFCLIQRGDVHFMSPYWDNVSEGAKALVRALLEVDLKRRLTASQTLQHHWLQHATAEKDHKGATKATDATTEKNIHRKLSGKTIENTQKQEISSEESHAAQINEYKLNKYEPDINEHKDKPTQQSHKITSDQPHSSNTEDATSNKQHSTDQNKPERPAEREDADSKQE
ncbi:serine/threonine-protein kinase DCLK1 [Triplophysa rosa]|uniref:non-specific serine/threonine protein kinase n=1 Tax=Triplophysa rosa TaxID=992332 RepID=A0A9W7TKZ4_TRIRA|nr:serine/threonine-protein kinase DCLK1 [Triplophysa rosa]KAI7798794.1 putative serine/threonine-protein kinase DCLK3 [Triplophysa rosa]